MKILLIVVGIIVLIAGVVAGVLAHPAFGVYRHVDKERIAKSPHYYNGMFQNEEPTPQFTGDTNGPDAKHRTFKMLKRFMLDKDTIRIPQEPIEAVKTGIKTANMIAETLMTFLFIIGFLHSELLCFSASAATCTCSADFLISLPASWTCAPPAPV